MENCKKTPTVNVDYKEYKELKEFQYSYKYDLIDKLDKTNLKNVVINISMPYSWYSIRGRSPEYFWFTHLDEKSELAKREKRYQEIESKYNKIKWRAEEKNIGYVGLTILFVVIEMFTIFFMS